MKNKYFIKKTKKNKDAHKRYTVGFIAVFACALVGVIGLTVHSSVKEKERMLQSETRSIETCNLAEVDEADKDKFIVGVIPPLAGGIHATYYVNIKANEGYRLVPINSSKVEIVATDSCEPHIEGCFDEHGQVYNSLDIGLLIDLNKQEIYELTHYTMYVPTDFVFGDMNSGLDELNQVKNPR